MVLSQLLAPLLSSVPPNDWYRAMIVQFLLAMVQDQLSNEEAGELLNQQVHVVATSQELRHITRKSVRLAGEYLGTEGPLCQVMATWPRHIDRFGWQYEKAFVGDRLLGADIVDTRG